MVMKHLPRILIHLIIGIITGNIFAVLVIGWPTIPHAFFVSLTETIRFLILGTVAGSVGGAIFGALNWLLKVKYSHRIFIGVIIGAFWGIAFEVLLGLVSTPQYWNYSLEWSTRSLIGGAIGGAISGAIIHIFQRILKEKGPFDPTEGLRVVNIINGIITGGFFGATIAIIIGLIIISPDGVFYSTILRIYFIPIIGVSVGIVYRLFIKATDLTIQKTKDGLTKGLMFGLVAFVYYFVIFFQLPISGDGLFFMMVVIGIPVVGFGVCVGVISELVEKNYVR